MAIVSWGKDAPRVAPGAPPPLPRESRSADVEMVKGTGVREEPAGRGPRQIHDDDDVEAAFVEGDVHAKDRRFLGIFPPRYLRTFSGLVHALGSTVALVVGNWLVLRSIFLGQDLASNQDETLRLAFFASAFVSGLLICTVFWNKVQSWVMVNEKGLSAKINKDFNRGRGGVAMMLLSGFPLLVLLCNRFEGGGQWRPLEDVRFSQAVALLLMAGVLFNYRLIKSYSDTIFVYGWSQFWLALAVLQHGTIANLIQAYPRVLPTILEREAYFSITCTQFGFLWVYLYSRRLVSKTTVREICKRYHPVMYLSWCFRFLADACWTNAPWTMWPMCFVCSLFAPIFLFEKVVRAAAAGAGDASSKTPGKGKGGLQKLT